MRKLGLESLLPALVAGCLTACGGAAEDDDAANTVTTPGEPQPLVCADSDIVSLTQSLRPVLETDFIGLYRSTALGPSPTLGAVELIESTGSLCGGASDPAACEAAAGAIDGERPGIRPDYWGASHVFVYTSGDTVGFVYDASELVAFLGTIDTPNEAAVVLWARNRTVECDAINEDESGYYARGTWQVSDCPFTDQELLMHVARDGSVVQTEVGERVVTSQGCAGRRPTCLVPAPPSPARSALGRYFAGLAHLESAAVVAFAILERELSGHGAPAELIALARKALGDEVRHAEIMGRLAQRFDAKPAPVELDKRRQRSLLEIAVENAAEGCVRETYGALQAHYQAAVADDPEVRSAWAIIAPEETEHAELSHALHRWLMSQLSEDDRRKVDAALRETLEALQRELAVEPEAELVASAGVPDTAQARRLYEGLEKALFSTLLEQSAA